MENSQEIVVIQPSEYGIEENRANEISTKFSPLQTEINAYNDQYQKIISSEITTDLIYDARELRLKLKNLRTKEVNRIHKAEKDFFLAGGKFVDAWKNKLNTLIEMQEEKLLEIEKYHENLEIQRIENIRIDRWNQLKEYTSIEPDNLGTMEEIIFKATLTGLKAEKDRIEAEERKAEEERLKKERIQHLHNTRTQQALPFADFWTTEEKQMNFGEVSDEDFNIFLSRIKEQKSDFEKKQEEIRKENERLKAEAEEKEKAAAAERKAEEEKREAERKEQKRLEEERLEKERKAKAEAEEKAKKEAEERKKVEIENERLRKEAEERKQKELAEEKAKKEAEEKEKIRLQQEEEKRKKAPIKNQINIWVDEFVIPEIPVDNDITKQISQKFESFKNWAKSEIEKL